MRQEIGSKGKALEHSSEIIKGLALQRGDNGGFQAGMKLMSMKSEIECSYEVGTMPASA